MNETTHRWKLTGLLDGIEDTNKQDACADALNKACTHMFDVETKPLELYAGCILPVISMMHMESKSIPTWDEIYKNLDQFIANDYVLSEMTDDERTEMCLKFVEPYKK